MSKLMECIKSKLGISFFLSLIVWGLAYSGPLLDMVRVWSQSNTYTHGFFILPISLWLIWRNRQPLLESSYQNEKLWLVPLAITQLVYLITSTLGINLLNQLCAYTSLILIVVYLIGYRLSLTLFFPLFYLIFAIPFGEEFVPQLQDITALFSVWMLNLVDIPVYREGLYLYIPNGTFEVAEACAGIRFLIASIALGTLYAYLNYQTYWKRAVFIIVACTLPILANGLRAFGIILIGHYSDMQHATGADHLVYGWFFFMFIIAILFWAGRFGQEAEKLIPPVISSNSKQIKYPAVILLSGILTTTPIYKALVIDANQTAPDVSLSAKLQQLPITQSETKIDWLPIFNDAYETWQGVINDRQAFIAFYPLENEEYELISGTHRHYDIEYWTLLNKKHVKISERQAAMLYKLVSVSGKQKSILAWYQTSSLQSPNKLAIKFNQLPEQLMNKYQGGYFIAINIADGENEKELIQWLNTFQPWQKDK